MREAWLPAQVWLGYQQSLRPCQVGLAINVDIACTAFLEEMPVPDYLAKSAGLFSVPTACRGNSHAEAQGSQGHRGHQGGRRVLGCPLCMKLPGYQGHAARGGACPLVQVLVSHMGARKRAFKVKGLTEEGSNRLHFTVEDSGQELTVAEYFERRYGRRYGMFP